MATLPVSPEALPPEMTPFQMLSTEAVTALEGALKSALMDNKVTRREEVRVTWKARDYCRGKQYAVYDSRNYIFVTMQASGEAMPMHMGTYDIISPQKRTFVSILSEQAPGVNFVPNDLQAANDVTAAKSAEKMRGRVDRMVEMKAKQSKAAGYLCTDGRVIAWTRIDESGKLAVDLFGVLESKVPSYAQDVDDWGYCVLSHERDVWKAKADFPELEKKIDSTDSGSADSSYERYARLGVISSTRGGNSETLKGVVTEHFCWLKKWRYAKIQDTVRAEIQQAFPNGLVIHAFGSTCVDVFAIDDPKAGSLAVEFPVDGEGQMRPALLSGVLDIQDAYNDIRNLMRELAEKGSPATWVNTDAGIDLDAIATQRAVPGAIHGIAAGSRNLADVIKQEEPSIISQQVVAMLPDLKQDAEYNTGAYAQLQGGEIGSQDTVGVNKLLTSQAKGQLGPAWSAIQRLAAKIYVPAIKLAAMLQQGPVAVSGASGQSTVDPKLILDGAFNCHPDQDSSFPETTADKRAALQAVLGQLGQDPKGSDIIFQPDNLVMIRQYSGLKDLIIPQVEARNKQLQQIEQMLDEPPIPHSLEETKQWRQACVMAQQQGQPPPPPPPDQPSVAIDEDWDFHQPMLDKIQEWLATDACSEAMRSGKSEGVRNIKLQGAQRRSVLAKQAQSAAPAPAPPKVTLQVPISDPSIIAQFASQAGATSATPQGEAQAQLPEVQKTVAQGQHAAAQATHVSVLAARERVKPFDIQPPPKEEVDDNDKRGA